MNRNGKHSNGIHFVLAVVAFCFAHIFLLWIKFHLMWNKNEYKKLISMFSDSDVSLHLLSFPETISI